MEYDARSQSDRSDFIGGIDNEALDFGQLEAFIQSSTAAIANSETNGTTNIVGNVVGGGGGAGGGVVIDKNKNNTESHLPESPPDSGSEPPYSPTDLHSLGLSASLIRHSSKQKQSTAPGQKIEQPKNDIGHLNHLQQQHHVPLYIANGTNGILPASMLAAQSKIIVNGQDPFLHQNPDALIDLEPQHHMHRSNATTTPKRLTYHDLGQTQEIQNLISSSEELTQLLPVVYSQTNNILSPPQQQQQQQHVHHSMQQQRMTEEQYYMQHIPPPVAQQQYHLTQLDITAATANASTVVPLPLSPIPIPIPIAIPEKQTSKMKSAENGTLTTKKRKLAQTANDIQQQISLLVKPEPDNLSAQLGLPTTKASSTPNPAIVVDKSAQMDSGMSSCSSLDNGQLQNIDNPDGCSMQTIRFSPFQQQQWHILCDQSLQELPIPHYRVDADKGFNFSNSDDAFVCQKKNHFQITCHAQLQGSGVFVRTANGLEKVRSYHLHFYGVKLEAPNQTIRVEQSQSDRSKKPFHPVLIDLQNGQISKVTVGRLHFSETTSNNMRKKGRPNPEQRYFQLIVGLHAHTHTDHFPIISYGSENIIVRASNPGQFESDVELCWQRGLTQEAIFHSGRVGINTDRPDECLVVHGNIKISGQIIQPSDMRAKEDISEMNTAEQLANIQKIRVVRYSYNPEYASYSGLKRSPREDKVTDTGVIAQEVRDILPDAIKKGETVTLPNGDTIENFLLVNKDRIYMENIGAVKELCKITDSLKRRVEHLERINNRLCADRKLKVKREGIDSNGNYCDLYDIGGQNQFLHLNKLVTFGAVFVLIAVIIIYVFDSAARVGQDIFECLQSS